MKTILLALFIPFSLLTTAWAGEAEVIKVTVNKSGANTYSFNVTIAHEDSGWQHYANKWEVIDEKGNVLATRVLFHPHENEQPFTRSLSGVVIPKNIKTISIRAYDLLHGDGGKEVSVILPE